MDPIETDAIEVYANLPADVFDGMDPDRLFTFVPEAMRERLKDLVTKASGTPAAVLRLHRIQHDAVLPLRNGDQITPEIIRKVSDAGG